MNDESLNFDKKSHQPKELQIFALEIYEFFYPALNPWCHQPQSATTPSVDVTQCISALDQRNKKETWSFYMDPFKKNVTV